MFEYYYNIIVYNKILYVYDTILTLKYKTQSDKPQSFKYINIYNLIIKI